MSDEHMKDKFASQQLRLEKRTHMLVLKFCINTEDK